MFHFFQLDTVMRIVQGIFWENIIPQPNDLLLLLELRRAMVLEDTFTQLGAAHHSDYKKPLSVNV